MQNHNNIPFSPFTLDYDSDAPVSENNISPRSPKPGSPWVLSHPSTPSPSLLYHCISALSRQEGTIHSVTTGNGLVFTGSESSRIRAWRLPECTERGSFRASCGDVRAILAFGNTIFTSHKDFKVRIWKVTSPSENFHAKKVAVLPKPHPFFGIFKTRGSFRHKEAISCMAYNQVEGLLYTGSWDRTIGVWRLSEQNCMDYFVAHEDQINSIVINQSDSTLFSCSSDCTVKIWRRVFGMNSHTLTMTLKTHYSPVNALALSASSQNSCFIYSGSSDGVIGFWEKEKHSGRFNHGGFLQGHRFSVLCLITIDKLLLSGSEDTTIRVWRREEGSYFHECLTVIEAHRGPVKSLAVALDVEKVMCVGFLLFSVGVDQAFKVWKIKVLPEEVVEYETSSSPVLSPRWVEKKLQHENMVMEHDISSFL